MAARAVRIVTEVAAVDRPFDYAVTDKTSRVALGDRVRVDFNNRSVRGWVTAEVAPDRELKPLTKWLGFGPPPSLLALLEWASRRWYSPLSRFLISSSPKRLVTELPLAPPARALAPDIIKAAWKAAPGVWQLSPTTDPLALALGAYEQCRSREGSLLVLVPTESWAARLRGRLEQRGCAVASGEGEWDRMRAGWPVVVGARGAALAPVPKLAGALLFDADDESFRSQAAPTWDATTMLRERCRREGAPFWCTSMIPSPVLLNAASYERDADVVGGWPRVEVVDRRLSDPRDGALSSAALDAAHRALRNDHGGVAVCVVLQRLGTGRLLACAKCGELARCTTCAQAEEEVDGGVACGERHEPRENFCRSCGATNLKRVRVGVTTLARDVAAQLSQEVSEVTASTTSTSLARVVVGTEAIWQQVRRCAVVIFADFDQYLLAPRESARREAITAVGKAGRLVGSRRDGRGLVIVQSRRGEDPVLASLRVARFDEIIEEDVATAQLLGLAPYGATAQISGEGAAQFVEGLVGFDVTTRISPEGFVVRAKDADTLTQALRQVTRPTAKFRVAVQ